MRVVASSVDQMGKRLGVSCNAIPSLGRAVLFDKFHIRQPTAGKSWSSGGFLPIRVWKATVLIMNVLIAFDKFKDSISAETACDIAAGVLRERRPDWTVETAPLTDGGEGFAEIMTHARAGKLHRENVTGPRFAEREAHWGMVELEAIEPELRHWLAMPELGFIAIVEMAQSSGLEILDADERDLWHTTTFGTGQIIARTHELEVAAILMGIGGSATNDLGLGALEALGIGFLDAEGKSITQLTPAKWEKVKRLDGEIPADLPAIRIACDVQNPLLGPNGAAAIYGPQKGLKSDDWERLNSESSRMAQMICDYFGTDHALIEEPGSGAAGGIGFGLRAACGARYVPGFELAARWLQINEKVQRANLIITGEGRFDLSSLQGKGPGTLIEMSKMGDKKSWVFAGQIAAELEGQLPASLQKEDIQAITPENYPLERALQEGGALLEKALRAKLDSHSRSHSSGNPRLRDGTTMG